jgi:predicted nucleic acid-binding protein
VDILFLDANVLFSAAYRRDSGLRRLWELSNAQLISSVYAIQEAHINLRDPQQSADLISLLESVNVVSPALPLVQLPSDITLPAKDRPILAAAMSAKATHLLTGDISHFGPYYGCTIGGVLVMLPGEYLRSRTSG